MKKKEINGSSEEIIIRRNLFKIGEKITFLNCGEIRYFQINPNEWNNVLSKYKEMGLNAVSVSVPWSFHEIENNSFDFITPEKDLDYFLHLCENKGFYIIIKPGPSISNIKNGGIPLWLIENHPKILILDENQKPVKNFSNNIPMLSLNSPTYLKFIQNYFNNLSQILRRHLYPHGGIIMIQIYNKTTYGEKIYETNYNPIHLEFYKSFLSKKYDEISKLNNIYGQNYLSFNSVVPPTNKSFNSAAASSNVFKMTGELVSNLDWMECKEEAIQKFCEQICFILRKNRLLIPFLSTIPNIKSPINIVKLNKCYKTGVTIGKEWNINPLNEYTDTLIHFEHYIEILKASLPDQEFISDFQFGNFDEKISKNLINIILRNAIGHGVKLFNYNFADSGDNFRNRESEYIQNKDMILKEKNIRLKEVKKGEYDWIDKNCDMIRYISDYLLLNGKSLVESTKVYDDIGILFYQPYTRIKFNTTKLGTIFDYWKYIGETHESEYHKLLKTIHSFCIKPRIIDVEVFSLEQMLINKIIFAPLLDFLDSKSMKKLKKYVENGGILVSFFDIPTHDENFTLNSILSDIYGINIDKNEDFEVINFLSKKYDFNDSSFVFNNDKGISLKDSEIIAYYGSKKKNKTRKILGIHRKYGKGHIYHFGFMIKPNKAGRKILEKLLNNVQFEELKTEYPNEIDIVRQKSKEIEEFVTVTNTSNKDLKNIDIILRSTINLNTKQDFVYIDKIDIPAKSAIQWAINKKLNDFTIITLCTSEINQIQSILRVDPKIRNIIGFHNRGSNNLFELRLLQKPSRILFNDIEYVKDNPNKKIIHDIFFEETHEDLNVTSYQLKIRYKEDLNFSIIFEISQNHLEIINFNFKVLENF